MAIYKNKKYRQICLFIMLAGLFSFVFFACMGRSTKADEEEFSVSSGPPPTDIRASEYIFFYTAVQGNPLCMIIAVQQIQVPKFFGDSKIKGKANAWLVSPGISKYIFSKKGKFRKDPGAPLNLVDDTLLLTTDKEEFAFYFPYEQEEYVILSNPIFLSRVRSDQGKEIRYGLMPARFLWKDRTIEGNLFYEQRELPETTQYASVSPFASLEPGARGYLLWAPDGEVLYLEKSGEIDHQGRARIALMQDRRGRWQETYDVDWQEPDCAFSSTPCSGEAGRFQLSIPLWDIEGQGDILSDLQGIMDVEEKEDPTPSDDAPSPGAFWTSLQQIPDNLDDSPLAFCLFKGSLRMDREIRTVYGIGMRAK